MDRGRRMIVTGGLLVLTLLRPGIADDFTGRREITSPRVVFSNKPPDGSVEDEPPAESAEAASFEILDPLPAPPSDEKTVATPDVVTPPVETVIPTPLSPEETIDTEPSWLNRVVDEHLLIWRELTGALEFIPGDGGSFGLTTIGTYDAAIKSETSPGAWLVPRFGWHFLSGPRTPHLSSQMYTLTLEFNFSLDLDSHTRLHLHLAPTWGSDFEVGGEGFRIIGGGLLTHDLSHEVMLAAGAVYLDRPDLIALPLGGIRWRPADNLELDLMFPRPRAAWRMEIDESGEERWFYVSGALGGNSWAFERKGGPDDRVGYRDLRLLIGCETREVDGTRQVIEAGYVFDRQLDFDRGPGDQTLPGTAVFRLGGTF